MTQAEEESTEGYLPGTIVFAKLKGYPWWPARIESDQEVPEKVLKKKTGNKADLYNVYFYGTRDYGFFGPDAIRPFNPVNVQDDLDAKKFRQRDLQYAVRQALNPTFYLKELQAELGKEKQEKQEKDIVKIPKKRGRKKKVLTEATAPEKKEGKRRGRKRKAFEQIDEEPKKKVPYLVDENNNHDELKGSAEYRKIYRLRHKLQRLVYNKKKGDIPIEDYPKILEVLEEIGNVNMTYDYLRDSKICRVLKAARGYPFETEVNVKDCCQKLMRTWKCEFIELQSTPTPETVSEHAF